MDGGRGTAFADRADVSPDTLWRFARGESVSARTLDKLRRALSAPSDGARQDSGSESGAGPAGAPSPDADPSWWAGYLAAANETLKHAHAMIGGANQQIAFMLANRARWQRGADLAPGAPFELPSYSEDPAILARVPSPDGSPVVAIQDHQPITQQMMDAAEARRAAGLAEARARETAQRRGARRAGA
jgi:transcriptional regulator with XRE-family HTH domain